jgi:uncharacterized membrane protein
MMTTPAHPAPPPAPPRTFVQRVRDRLLAGLLVVLPIVITVWLIGWLYAGLDAYVIEPAAGLLLWKVRNSRGQEELPAWFEFYAAPLIALLVIVAVLYVAGLLAQSRLRRGLDWLLLRVPIVSIVYDAVRNVLQCFDKPSQQAQPQRLVLIGFPHPGMRLPAFVTSTCRDIRTQKTLLCVYVPTTPVPTSGFFLMVPEEEVTELNWSTEQTLQAIISGGLTAPPEVSYFSATAVANAPLPPPN